MKRTMKYFSLIVNYCLEKVWNIVQILSVERSHSRKKPNLCGLGFYDLVKLLKYIN